jgi:hypothetical protein
LSNQTPPSSPRWLMGLCTRTRTKTRVGVPLNAGIGRFNAAKHKKPDANAFRLIRLLDHQPERVSVRFPFLSLHQSHLGWDKRRFAAPAHHLPKTKLVGRRSKRACPTLRNLP